MFKIWKQNHPLTAIHFSYVDLPIPEFSQWMFRATRVAPALAVPCFSIVFQYWSFFVFLPLFLRKRWGNCNYLNSIWNCYPLISIKKSVIEMYLKSFPHQLISMGAKLQAVEIKWLCLLMTYLFLIWNSISVILLLYIETKIHEKRKKTRATFTINVFQEKNYSLKKNYWRRGLYSVFKLV